MHLQLNECKSCGGVLHRIGNHYVCQSCGNKWTIDAAEDVHVVDRANAWAALRNGDFDHAAELFETIHMKEPKDHEAYWGLSLASAGIMYVVDYEEHKKVPTCNNISEDSFVNSKNVKKAIELAPADIADGYRHQAEQIEQIRLEWLQKARKEPPYDIFISYKDSDREHGLDRTQDSIDAQDLYNMLTAEGYKVFFSRISLRDKVSEHYEPYIYNALKTAKVMIVFGEKPEYFNATWVKNEWSRFKKRIESGEKHKNSLVVVCKNMNPGDLPVVLKSRQCLNATDITFSADLLRHIEKVIALSKGDEHLEKIKIQGGQISKKATSLTKNDVKKREIGQGAVAQTSIDEKKSLSLVESYIKEKQWEDAGKLLENVLFTNPSFAEAIWCKLMIAQKVSSNPALVKNLDRFKPEDYALVEKALNCASKEFAGKILDLLYQSAKSLSTVACEKLYHLILPYRYERRAQRLKESFDWCISKREFTLFKLLLTALESEDVDDYIAYNSQYIQSTLNHAEKRECTENILAVDEGNRFARMYIFESELSAASDLKAISESFENVLKYSENMDGDVLEALIMVTGMLSTPVHCKFAKQLLKYHTGELLSLRESIVTLANRMIEKSFFDDAQYFFNVLLTINPEDADAFWGICLAKTNSTSESQIVNSPLLLNAQAEYNKYLSLVGEERRVTCMRLAKKQQQVQKSKRRKKVRVTIFITAATLAIIAAVLSVTVIIPSMRLKEANELFASGNYEEANKLYQNLNGFSDSSERAETVKAVFQVKAKQYDSAVRTLLSLGIPVEVTFKTEGGRLTDTQALVLGHTLSLDASTIPLSDTAKANAGEEATHTYDSSVDFSGIPTPQRDGYRFLEWEAEAYEYDINGENSVFYLTLKATWSENEYVIEYDLGGGVVPEGANPVEYGVESNTITLINPTRDGYVFLGWTGTDFSEPTLEVTIPNGSFGDKTFTANWKANEWTWTLDANGGNCDSSELVVTYGTAYELPVPAWEGHVFLGWYVEDDMSLVESGVCQTNVALALVAQWEKIEYTITYELNGGSVAGENPENYDYDSTITLIAPTRRGYIFQGWQLNGEGELQTEVTIPQGSIEDRTYTAFWVAIQSTVTLDANGGTCDQQQANVVFDEFPSLPTPHWEGHTFSGWYVSGNKVSNDEPCDLTENCTLVAQWDAIDYTITYYLNGGTNAAKNPATYTYHDEVVLRDPQRYGYIFLGWTYSGQDTPVTEVTIPETTTGNKTFTAHWEAISSYVTLDAAGGVCDLTGFDVTYDAAFSLPVPEWEGHDFVGWYAGDTLVSGDTWMYDSDTTLTAHWDAIVYSITYNLNGGMNAIENPDIYTYHDTINLVAPTRVGYTFLGWTYEGQDTPLVNVTISFGSIGDREYTAHWEANGYVITLQTNGGQVESPELVAIFDHEYTLPTPIRPGYTFTGWYLGDELMVDGVWTRAENVTLTATWSVNTYSVTLEDVRDHKDFLTITFNHNYSGSEDYVETLNSGDALPHTYMPTRDGFLFAGWYTDPACEGMLYSFSENLSEDLVLYAKWLEYNQQAEGIVPMNGSTAELSIDGQMRYFAFLSLIDQNITLYTSHTSGDPVLELYDANMNYLSSDDDGYGSRDSCIVWSATAGQVYYVSVRDYNVGNVTIHLSGTFIPGGGVAEVGQLSGWFYADGYDFTTSVQFDSEITLPTPSRVGYVFEGWYAGDLLVESGLWQVPSDTVLVASWRPLAYTLTFDANGGTMESDTMEVYYDTAYTLPIPTRPGYSFAGWYCDGVLLENGVWTSSEGMSLVARWTENTYSIMLDDLYNGLAITYNENYLGAPVYRHYYAQGDTLVYPDIPVRDGYLFTGWYTTAACERRYDFTTSVSENVTLYAGWIQPAQTNNGTMIWGGSVEGVSFTGDEIKYFAFVPLKSQWVTFYTTHTGGDPILYLYDVNMYQQAWDEDNGGDLNARFDVWVDAGNVYYIGLSLRESGTGSVFMESAELPYAGGTVNMSSDHWQPRPGYDHTIQIVYGYTYTLPELTRDGYEFAGWYNGDTLMEMTGTWDIPSDVVLVPHWIANTYTVTLDPNTGALDEDSAVVTFDEIVTLPTPTKTGYVFQGWYFGEVRVDGSAWTYAQNATLVAHWVASDNVQYTVHHYLQNLENDEYTFFESTTHTGTADAEILAAVGFYAGFISPEATLTPVNADGSTEISYYYDRSVVHVTLEVNGGDSMETISLKYGEEFALPDATRTGYTFGGWFSDAALTIPFTSATIPNEDTTLYAWWSEENKPGDFNYSAEDVIVINGYTGEGTTFTVPSHIGGYPVGAVAAGAFADLTSVTRIEIPVTVTSLGEGAFAGCVALEELVLPSVGSSGNHGYTVENDVNYPWVIDGQGNLTSTNHGNNSDSYVTITALLDLVLSFEYRPSSEHNYDRLYVHHNGSCVVDASGTPNDFVPFTIELAAGDVLTLQYHKDGSSINGDDCIYIRNFHAGSRNGYLGTLFGQTELEGTVGIVQGEATYYLPESLTSVTSNGTELSAGAFENCTTLEEIYVPNLTHMGEGAFANCSALTQLNSDTEGHFVLGAGITQIPDHAFEGCTGMESMTVEGVITTIGERVFEGCTSLTSFGSDTAGQMILPDGLTTIERDAFRGLTGITDIVVPNSVTTIGMGAFGGCSALESISLPFVGRSENEGEAQYRVLGYIFGDGTPDDDTLDMSETVFMTSGDEGFTSQIQSGDQYYYYAIPASLHTVTVTRQTRMYAYMFRNCDSITHLYLPDQLTVIENYAFMNMAGLVSITVPNSVTEIGNGAFMGCNALESITLPFVGRVANTGNSEQRMFGYIFGCYGANNYQEDLGLTMQYYNTSNNYYCYFIPASLRSVTISGTAQTALPHTAFSGCTMLTSVTLPDTMTVINSLAFYGCTNLASLNSATAGTFVIPAGVTHIDDYAFWGCTSMTALVTGDTLVTIDLYAFAECSGLVAATLGNGLQNIEHHAFYNCVALNRINSNDAGVVNLPGSLVNIRYYAFENAATPTTLVVPNSVVRIEEGAFKGWNALVNVTIPFVGIVNSSNNGMEYVFGYIFGYNSNAQEGTTAGYYKYYYIPQTIRNVTVTMQTYVSNYAFYNCSFIQKITLPEGTTRIGNGAFQNCTGLKMLNSSTAGTFKLPASLTYIEDYAFSGCTEMTTLVTGDALVTIDPRAFENCSKLATVTLGAAVENINDHAFYNCVALNKVNSTTDKTLTIPNSVKYIRDYAFENAGLITKLVVPDSVVYIGRGAFKGCNALVDVTLPFVGYQLSEGGNNWQYVFGYIFDLGSSNDGVSVKQKSDWYLIPTTIKTVTVTKQTSIPWYAFQNCSFIEKITIPAETTAIGHTAFCGCTNLTKLNSDTVGTFNLPASLTYIEDYAFAGCTSMVTLVTGDALVTIDTYAFADCFKLATVTLGNSVQNINDYAFAGCGALNKVNSTTDKTMTFPASLKTIGNWAFKNAKLITKLIVPDSVETIGQGAFLGCEALVEVTLPFIGMKNHDNVNDWRYVFGYIFDRGEQNAEISVNQGHAWYVIPRTIRTVTITQQLGIPYHAFRGCFFIESITVPDTVTRIGECAFLGCTNLSKLNSDTAGTFNIPAGVTVIGNYAFGDRDKDGCTSMTTLVTGDALTSIGVYSFGTCSKLANVTLGSSLETIGEHAFYGCTALNKVNSTEDKTMTFPASLKTIGNWAFENANKITTLIVPDSVESIGQGAFLGCEALVEVTLPFIGMKNHDNVDDWRYVFGYIFDRGEQNAEISVNQGHAWYVIPRNIRTVTITQQLGIPSHAFRGCFFIESITVPDTVTRIGAYAFQGCTKLSKLNSNTAGTFKLPDGVTVLNENVFYECDALTTFIPGSSLETIGTRAFYGCDHMVKFNTTQDKTIVIPDTVKTIGAWAFENVYRVTSLIVPDSVTEILESAFKGCTSLKSMTLPFTGRKETATAHEAVLGYIFGWDGGSVTQHYYTNNRDYTIGFHIPAITSVTITKQTKIPYGAFSGITTLQTVNLREDTETISDYAFYGCTALTGANIGQNVTSIGYRAFENNSSLVSIQLPGTLTTIGERAFSGCVKLNRINSSAADTINLPDGLVSIGSHAFHNLSTVKKIVVPDSVTALDWGAFNGCSSLVEITLPFIGWQEKKTEQASQTVFGYIFGDNSPQDNSANSYDRNQYFTSSDLKLTSQFIIGNNYYHLTIPTTLRTVTVTRQTSIPEYAFKNCDLLETINLPVGATVAETALENCSATVNYNVNPVTAPVWDGETVADGFASGTGTQDDPFIIFTPEQLVYLAQQVNAGNSYENTYFALSSDIMLSGNDVHAMTVIGRSVDTPFAGHFDGRSHVIRSFNITGTADDLAIGLFGYVTGSVRNLGVERATFTSNGTTLEAFAGGLVAYLAEGGVIENCYSTASVTVSGTNELHVGGLVGYNAGTIRNSYARGSVSATSNVDAYAGGFAANNAGVIENCFAYGGVSAHGRDAGASFNGGFVAVQTEDAELTNCYRNEAQYLKHYNTEGTASGELGTAASNSAIRAALMAEGSTWVDSVWDFSTVLPRFK